MAAGIQGAAITGAHSQLAAELYEALVLVVMVVELGLLCRRLLLARGRLLQQHSSESL